MRDRFLVPLGLTLLVCLAHGGGVDNGWIHFDDPVMVRDEVRFDTPTLAGVLSLASEVKNHAFLPLYHVAYVPEVLLSGKTPRALHAASLVWHAIVTLLVYALWSRTFLSSRLAAAAAALFAVHPVAVESVAWISGRKDQVSLALLLAAMLALLRHLRGGGWGSLVVALALSLASTFAKASTLVYPALAGLLALAANRAGPPIPRARTVRALAALAISAVGPLLVHLAVARQEGAAGAGALHDAGEGVGLFFEAAWAYASHLVLPWGLSIHYDLVPGSLFTGDRILGAVLVFGLCALPIWARRGAWLPLGFGVAWMLAAMAPFNDVWPRTAVTLADRYLAVALPAFGLVVAALIARLPGPWFRRGLLLVVLCGLTLATRQRTLEFADGSTVFLAALEVQPKDPLAPLMIADAILETAATAPDAAEPTREALHYLGMAVSNARHPVLEVRARLRLADTLLRAREFASVLVECDRLTGLVAQDRWRFEALGLDPDTITLLRAQALVGLGRALEARDFFVSLVDRPNSSRFARFGLLDLDLSAAFSAVDEAKDATTLDLARAAVDRALARGEALLPDLVAAGAGSAELLRRTRLRLGNAMLRARWRADRLFGALGQGEILIDSTPTRPEGYLLRARVRQEIPGEESEALNDLMAAARRAPHDPSILLELAGLQRALGRKQDAVRGLDAVIALGGDTGAARRMRADIYLGEAHGHLSAGNEQRAAIAIAEALRTDPTNADARCVEGELLEARGSWVPAASSYRLALEAAPEHEGARRGLGRFHQARGLKLLAELRATLERLPVEERERKEEELREEIVAEYGRAVELAGAAQDVSIARQYVDSMRSRNRLVAARRLVAEADAARRLGDARKALDLYEEAVRLDDRNIDALFAKGILELGAGDLETAARSLDAVLALNSDHLGALFHVAQIHHVKRRTPDAKRALERFLERAEPHAEELSAEIREARALLEQLASEPSEGR